MAYTPNFNDPAYLWNTPTYGVGQMAGALAGTAVDPTQTGSTGPLSGTAGTWQQRAMQFLDPQVALPIAAQLMGPGNFSNHLAGAFQAAGQAIPGMQQRQAMNAYLKAKSGLNLTPEEQQLLQSDPELSRALIVRQLTPTPPTFGKIGQGPTGSEQYGWIDPFTKTVTPVAAPGTGSSSLDLPTVGINEQGQADPAQQAAFLATLPKSDQATIKSIANYEVDPTKDLSLRGNRREAVLSLVRQYDPTYDMTQYGARAAMRKSVTSGNYSQAINSSNLVIQHIDTLKKAYDGLRNTDYPTYNALTNPAAVLTGNTEIQTAMGKFQVSADAVASELAKVFKGTGASSEEEVKAWRASLSPNMPPSQFKASVDTLVSNLLKSRLDTIRSQFQSAMGKPATFTMLTPHSRQVLQQLNIDPTEIDSATDAVGAPVAAPAAAPAASGVTHVWDPQSGLRPVQ